MICNTTFAQFLNFSHILFPETVDSGKKTPCFLSLFCRKNFSSVDFLFFICYITNEYKRAYILKKCLSKRKNADAFQV